MNWITAFLSRIANAPAWRDIATAPFDRAIELAVIDGEIGVLSFPLCAPRRRLVRRRNIETGVGCRDALALPAARHSSGQLLLTNAARARLHLS